MPRFQIEKRGIFNKSKSMIEINLWLDSYDDMYSDFDSRQYEKRRISKPDTGLFQIIITYPRFLLIYFIHIDDNQNRC